MLHHMTRSQRAKAKGGATWSSNARWERWRKHVAGVKSMTHQPRTVWVNNIYDDLIMVSGGQSIRSVELVGNQRLKALMQMDRACSSPDMQTISQDDVRFSLRLADVKAPSTTHQVEFVTYLFDTNSTLIVTWGNLVQCSSLLGRILYVSLVSHSHPALPLNCIVCPVLFVSQRISTQRLRAPPRYSLSRPSPRPPPFHCFAQVFAPRPLLEPAPSNKIPIHRKPNSLQHCVPPSGMENIQRNQSAPEFMHLQGVKGLLVGFVQLDPEAECVGCQRM
jgi:hypothetical protein